MSTSTSQTIAFGETVALQASPSKLHGFTSFLRQYHNMPVVHFAPEETLPSEALLFTLASPTGASGVIRTGDALVLLCGHQTVCIASDGHLVLKTKHHVDVLPHQFMFCADNIPMGIPLTKDHIVFLTRHNQKWAKISLPPQGYFWNLVENWDGNQLTVFTVCPVFSFQPTQPIVTAAIPVTSSPPNTAVDRPATLPRPSHYPTEIMLTIDDFGVTSAEYLKTVVDYLDQHHLPSLWFANGTAASQNPEGVKHVIRSQYAHIGIHTYTHANMGVIGVQAATKEVADCIHVMKTLHSECGQASWEPKFFRFPFLDDGSSQGTWVQAGLQGMLQMFGFQPSVVAQQTMPYSAHNIDVDGLFINDGPYKKQEKTDEEFDAFVKESFQQLGTSMPTLFLQRCVFGCHDQWKLLRLIQILHQSCQTKFLPIE